MKGHVFEGYGESLQKKQHAKTVDAIAGLISNTIDYPKDVVSICKSFVLNKVMDPKDLILQEEKSPTKNLT